MVAPLVGPITVVTDHTDFYRVRYVYRQKRPYTEVLPYLHTQSTVKTRINRPGSRASDLLIPRSSVKNSSWANHARILAYEKFKARIGDRSQMGESLGQINKSLDMVAARATQLFLFTRAIKRGRFGDAQDILRSPAPRKRHPAKEQSSNWLEYHLGWEPAIKDIYTAMDFLQTPLKNTRVRGRATVTGGILADVAANYPWEERLYEVLDRVSVQYTAEVAISNPNLYLANTMGVLNPFQIAWQLMPLSFILDWIINVEQFLGAFTDLYGLTVNKATTTTSWEATNMRTVQADNSTFIATMNGSEREIGIITPSLGLRPLKALSWQRGLTAVALLTGSLKSLK